MTTPVPPMPTMRTVKSSASTIESAGSAMSVGGAGRCVRGRSRALVSVVTVANDGQSPCRQEKSKLQLVWWICVLRPNGVSTGWTDKQLLLSPQSPQPSHTRSLMTTRNPGVATVPRARPRRFSAAQAWSWMRTVTPLTDVSTSSASSNRLRSQTSMPAGNALRGCRSGSSLVTITRATPSSRSIAARSGTVICPSGSWPPVIATVPL